DSVLTTIAVGSGASGIAITPDGTHVYVANATAGTVSVINTATNSVQTISSGLGTTPVGVAVSADGTKAYVANQGSGTVSVIDTSSNTVVNTITSVGTSPTRLTMSPDGTRLYVSLEATTGGVAIIDTLTNAVSSLSFGNATFGLAFTPDGRRLFASNFGSNDVTVVDGVTAPLFQVAGGTLTIPGTLID